MELKTLHFPIKKNSDFIQINEITDKIKRNPSFVKPNSLKQESRIRIKTQDSETIISTSNIMYCKADDCYTVIFIAESNTIHLCKVLKKIEEKLSRNNFVRCHDSYLVNIDFIKKIKGKSVKKIELIDGTILPCSRRKLKNVLIAIDSTLININFSDN